MSYYDDILLSPPDVEEEMLEIIDREDQEPTQHEIDREADKWESEKEQMWSCKALGIRPVGR